MIEMKRRGEVNPAVEDGGRRDVDLLYPICSMDRISE